MVAPSSAKTQASRRTLEERYRTLFRVGKGGMGAVEVALERGEGSFERIVALKRLLPEATGDLRITDMFLREARLGALLTHPNVVRAYDFGEIRGELFLAMEYVEGQTLASIVKRAREKGVVMPHAVIAHVLAEACDGLHAAHELCDVGGQPLSVVHRDVSPHNVMISYDGHVKLLDFGVAKIDETSSTTKTGEIKGKMAYMSPEQAMGEALDRTSDLWAVGALLYECVTGKRMWGDGTDMEVLRRLALEEPPALPEAPAELTKLYRALVARKPGDRPRTAREVADELRRFAVPGAERVNEAAVCAFVLPLFEEEAAADRARLRDALEEAAPEQAEELRDSLAPAEPGTVVSKRPGDLAEDHATLEAIETAAADPPAAGRRRPTWALALALAGAAAVAIAVWPRTPAPRTSAANEPVAAPIVTADTPVAPTAIVPPASATAAAPPSAASVARDPARPLVVRPTAGTQAPPASAAPSAAESARPPVAPRPSVSAGEVDPAPF